ncbi:MAG: squalene/phytoene synthase family protein, partial [Mariprofundaceae bacterium]
RLMLALHGVDDPDALHASDAVCTALQLINFWQDFSVDLPKGRCYLPETWLQMHGLSARQLIDWGKADELDDAEHNRAIQATLKHAIVISRDKLMKGYDLLPHLPLRLRLQIAATLHGGACMLDKIGQLERPLAQRATLKRSDWRHMAVPIIRDALFPGKVPATDSDAMRSPS